MNDHDTDHEVGAPKMQCAEIPAQGLIKIQILQTGVSLISGGHVDKGQTDASHDLEDKTKQGATAENIKPTACTCRHCVTCGGFEELADMQSVINPESNVSQHPRFLFSAADMCAETLSCRLLKKISEARRTVLVIVSVKRDGEICTSTTTNTNWSESVEWNETYESFSATCPASQRFR